MNELYEAVDKKDASKIANHFQHKRTPSPGLDVLLLASSEAAQEALTRLAESFDQRDLQVLLLSPTAFEAPWAALHLSVQYLMQDETTTVATAACSSNSVLKDNNDTVATVVVSSMQAFLQQVAVEWKIRKPNSRRSSIGSVAGTETNESPRVWLERLVQEILRPQFQQSSAPQDKKNDQLFQIISTIASLAEAFDEEFHYIVIQLILLCRACRGATLVAWLKLLHGRAHAFGTDQWISLVQRLESALAENAVDATTCRETFRCVMSLYRSMASNTSSSSSSPSNGVVTQAMVEDPVWHALVLQLYEISYLARDSSSVEDFEDFHRLLEASLMALPSDVLLKWLRWTLHNTETTETKHRSVRWCMALAIYKAWHSQGKVKTPGGIKMGLIFWEEVSSFVFEPSGQAFGCEKGADALGYVRDLLLQHDCQYRGRGNFHCCTESCSWLSDASLFVYQCLQIVSHDASTERLLIDTVFDTLGNHYVSVNRFDLLLSIVMMTILFESNVQNQTFILARMRRFFMSQDEEEGLQETCCFILRLVADWDPKAGKIWECFSSILCRELSSSVFAHLTRALMGCTCAQKGMLKLCEEGIAHAMPSACIPLEQVEGKESISLVERNVVLLCRLCLRGSPQVRKDALHLVESFLNGSRKIPYPFYETFYISLNDMLNEGAMDAFALEKLFQAVSSDLVRVVYQYQRHLAESDQTPLRLRELAWKSRLLARILSRAKDISNSEVLNESMWPYDTFLESLFEAVVEWQEGGTGGSQGRNLDVSNNDFHVAAAIASLSLTYQWALNSTVVMETVGAPTVESVGGKSPKAPQHGFRHSPVVALANCPENVVVRDLRQDIAELCLAEGLWNGKPEAKYKSFMLALSSFISPAENDVGFPMSTHLKLSDLLELMDKSFLSVIFGDFEAQKMTAQDIDGILALVLFVCKRVASTNSVISKRLLEKLMVIYDAFCSEEKIAGMLLFLEARQLSESEGKSYSWRVLDPTGRVQLEASVRKLRVEVLRTLSDFLDLLTASSALAVNQEVIDNVVLLLRSLCKDLKLALHCRSGGVDADLCIAFINCIKNTCWFFTSSLNKVNAEAIYLVRGFCREALECIDGVSQSIDLSNVDVLGAILSLTTRTLPTVVNLAFQEGCKKNGKVQPSRSQQCICLVTNGVSGICLQYNRKRFNPLEEVKAPNAYTLIGETDRWGEFGKEKATTAVTVVEENAVSETSESILGGSWLSKLSDVMDSERIWERAFTSTMAAYLDVMYYSEEHIQEDHTGFQSNEGRCTFMRWHISELRAVQENIVALFEQPGGGEQSGQASSFGATTLPASMKDWLCAFQEQFCVTLEAALVHLKSKLCDDTRNSAYASSFVEALSLVVAWLSLDGDLCQLSQAWLEWEERVASRAGSKESVVVVADTSFYKDLAKISEQTREITQQLGSLCSYLKDAPDKSCFNDRVTLWSESKLLVDQVCGESFDLRGRLERRFESLQNALSKQAKDTSEKAQNQAKRKKRKTPSDATTTTGTVFRNRNQIVEDWLQKDKGADSGNKAVDDTFADLEDFLVED